MGFLDKLTERFKRYFRMSSVEVIARRYMVTNMFDATLATLGIILGIRIYGVGEASVIVGTCLGAALGLGVSGVVSTYITERAERIAEIKRLERVLLTNLKNSDVARARSYAAIITAIISGASPVVAVLLPTLPYITVLLGMISYEVAFLISLAISLTILFILGAYLGKISKQNKILYGLVTLAAGLLVAAVLITLEVL